MSEEYFELDKKPAGIYAFAIGHYGEHNQCLKAMEECGELVQALAKFVANPIQADSEGRLMFGSVLEELADVHIMVQQMAIVFGREAFDKAVLSKTNRLAMRMGVELAAQRGKRDE